MKYFKISLYLFFGFILASCTKLDESFRGELSENNSSTITAAQILVNAYNSLNGPYQTGDLWHISQHTTDETIAPTRGGDWDDNGQWRALHAHTWNADQGQINGAYNGLLSAQFAASNVLEFNPSTQQEAEARFIRALTIFAVLDGYDQVPYREDLKDYKIMPVTLKGTEAADFVISELNAIINDLPDTGPAYVASKNAARALLMKVYLNYATYANRGAQPEPSDFDPAHMQQVITLANQITGYNVSTNPFFDNFAPNNNSISTENIFTLYNQSGDRGGNMQGTAFQVHHYNMNPGGWNGFSTLSDFYAKFEAVDKRRGMYYTYPGALPNPGQRINVGFLVGQQYNLTTDVPLTDRQGAPLAFTPQVQIRETGTNLEMTGIRVNKYPFDYGTQGDQKNNDWVIFRYADVLLMKAEAMLRTNDAAGALPIVNDIRAKRGATALGSLTLDNLLDERGREMYWEGWRRQDLIRFGKYLESWQEKTVNDTRNLLFPIPNTQLAVNPNLTQNPGY